MITGNLLKYVDETATLETKLAAARLPEELVPSDQLTVAYYLSKDENPQVKKVADDSLRNFPIVGLVSALTELVDPLVIKEIADLYQGDDTIITMCILNTKADEVFIVETAMKASEAVVTALVEETDRVVKNPGVLEALKKNPYTPPSVLKQAHDMVAGTYEKPAPKEIEGIEGATEEEKNVNRIIQTMTIGEKIKFAMTGNKEARGIFLKEANKMIIAATLKNPRITEAEILQLVQTKGTAEDTLRAIERNREWMKNYTIKLGLATNAKTPITISVRLVNQLFSADLKKMAKSKSIPGIVASAAKKALSNKKT